MPVRDSIIELRNRILQSLGGDPAGFTRDLNVLDAQYQDGQARHQVRRRNVREQDSWDSYIYVKPEDPAKHVPGQQRTDVLIILQYLHDEYPGWQRIELQGENGARYSFALRLCVYDLGRPPRLVRRDRLYKELINELRNANPNFAEPQGVERWPIEIVGETQVGHIVNLPIPEGVSIIDAVTAGVRALLPLADCYAKNRAALFARI